MFSETREDKSTIKQGKSGGSSRVPHFPSAPLCKRTKHTQDTAKAEGGPQGCAADKHCKYSEITMRV